MSSINQNSNSTALNQHQQPPLIPPNNNPVGYLAQSTQGSLNYPYQPSGFSQQPQLQAQYPQNLQVSNTVDVVEIPQDSDDEVIIVHQQSLGPQFENLPYRQVPFEQPQPEQPSGQPQSQISQQWPTEQLNEYRPSSLTVTTPTNSRPSSSNGNLSGASSTAVTPYKPTPNSKIRNESTPSKPEQQTSGEPEKVKIDRFSKLFVSILNSIFVGPQDKSSAGNRIAFDKKIMEHPLPLQLKIDSLALPTLTLESITQLENCIIKVPVERIENEVEETDILRLYEVLTQSFVRKYPLPKGDDLLKDATVTVPEVTQTLQIVQKGLRSAQLLLDLYSLGFKNRNLSPEIPMTALERFLSKIVLDFVLPLTPRSLPSKSSKSNNNNSNRYEAIYINRKLFNSIHHDLRKVFESLNRLLGAKVVAEHSINRLEDIARKLIFVSESDSKGGEPIFSATSVDSLRAISTDLILTIFSTHPNDRHGILNGMLMNVAHLPDSKISSRSHLYPLDNGMGSIQLSSALFMKMVHISGESLVSGFSRNSRNGDDDESDGDNENDDGNRDNHVESSKLSAVAGISASNRSAINELSTTCNYIIKFLIKKVFPEKGDPKASKEQPYKELFQLLTKDFLKVLRQPEWPAAELLISTILVVLVPHSKSDVANSANFALDIFGLIAPQLYQFKRLLDDNVSSGKGKIDLNPNETNTVDCTPDQLTDIVSDMNAIIATLGSTFGSQYPPLKYLSTLFLSRILSLQNLDLLSPDLAYICNEFMEKSIQNDPVYDSIILLPPRLESIVFSTRDQLTAAYNRMLLLRPIAMFYDSVISYVVAAMTPTKKTSIKSKALSILNSLQRADGKLFLLPPVQQSLANLLSDESKLVRDSAVDAVGTFVIANPEFAKVLYPVLCERCNDTGLSVRKKVIGFLNLLYGKTDDVNIRIHIMKQLIPRLNDEDESVRTLVIPILNNRLFSYPLKPVEAHQIVNFMITYCKEDMNISPSRTEYSDSLKFLIRRLLGPGSLRKAETYSSAQILIGTLFKRANSPVNSSIDDDENDKSTKEETEIYFAILSFFAEADGSLISSDDLISLYKFIEWSSKPQNGYQLSEDAQSYSLLILKYGLQQKNVMDANFLASFEKYLFALLTESKVKDLPNVAACLGYASSFSKTTQNVAKALRNSVLELMKRRDKLINQQLSHKDKTQTVRELTRLLHLIGNIARYCNLDKHTDMLLPPGKNYTTMTETIVRYLISLTKLDIDEKIRKVALRNIGIIWIGDPGLFTRIEVIRNLFDRIMISRRNEKVDGVDESDDLSGYFDPSDNHIEYRDERVLVMKIMTELLYSEEESANLKASDDLESHTTTQSTNSIKREKSSDDQKVDLATLHGKAQNTFKDAASSSSIQLFLDRILIACLSHDKEYSLAAAQLLERAVRQNFADPNRCAKIIIALEASSDPRITRAAKLAHERIHLKFKSRIEQSYAEGIRLAARCHQKMPQQFSAESGPFGIIWPIIRDAKNSKKTFLDSLMKKIEINFEQTGKPDTDLKIVQNTFNFVLFVADGLSNSVVFRTNDDVHKVIYEIESILSVTNSNLAMKITGIYESDEKDETSEVQWAILGETAAILLVLWRLKEFLKSAYDLTDAKCREWSTWSVKDSKPAEKHVNVDFRVEEIVPIKGILGGDHDSRGRLDAADSLRLLFSFMTEVEDEMSSPDVTQWIAEKLGGDYVKQVGEFLTLQSPKKSPIKPSPKRRRQSNHNDNNNEEDYSPTNQKRSKGTDHMI